MKRNLRHKWNRTGYLQQWECRSPHMEAAPAIKEPPITTEMSLSSALRAFGLACQRHVRATLRTRVQGSPQAAEESSTRSSRPSRLPFLR